MKANSTIPVWVYRIPAAGLIVVFTVLLFRTAWVGDDAYISFRAVENFLHGYGPVFNVGERVQVFTHPLWFFLMSAVNAVTQRIGALNPWAQVYSVAVYLSIAVSLAAVLGLALGVARSGLSLLLSLTLLVGSKAFIDYSTSGLENALSHLLLVLFLWAWGMRREVSTPRLMLLVGLASLAALNRYDTVLLYVPLLALLFFTSKKKLVAFAAMAAGGIPLVAWEIFSVLYYGFPFPNTAYAKLNTGIPALALMRQGLFYYLDSLRYDPLTLLAIFATLVWLFWRRPLERKALAAGVGLYLLYVIYIGGDFMSGRYFSLPLLACAGMIAAEALDDRAYLRLGRPCWAYGAALLAAGLLAVFNPLAPLRSPLDFGQGEARLQIKDHGITDERAFYYPRTGLLASVRVKPPPGSKFGGRNWVYDPAGPHRVRLTGPLGFTAYMLGPNVHVYDKNALSDALLSRTPLLSTTKWRIGHFHHIIPPGYEETLKSGENRIEDPNVAAYYDKLRVVIRGPLFDRQRLAEIWNLNTGKYDELVRSYRPDPATLEQLEAISDEDADGDEDASGAAP